MKLAPAGIGAEPKKLALLGAILVLGAVVYWTQNRPETPAVSATGAPPAAMRAVSAPPPPEKQTPPQSAEPPGPAIERRAPVGVNSDNDTFVPSMKVKDDLDVSRIDPRIRLDLLEKVRAVPLEGGSSSLFEFSKPPEPPAPKVDAIHPAAVPVPPPAHKTTPAAPPKPAGPPPAPPIPFKYYGYAGMASDGQLEGFFIEGDPATGTIYPKHEGDTIKDRYKIVRIGIRSAVVEDTVSHNQQTLKLPEDQQ